MDILEKNQVFDEEGNPVLSEGEPILDDDGNFILDEEGNPILSEGEPIVEYPEVALENEAFVRPDDGYWYEVSVIPSAPQQIELGTEARSRWYGILQVNICVPKDSGTRAMNERFDAIAKHFRSGLILEGVRIVKTYRTSAVDDGDFLVLPVTVEWWSDLDR
ncbi:MAG: hypothetical protein KBT03_07525 [Bacteroidales bacterium]|nr:hypothetical protein [Candidatus Scybalousia scybalohippi]